MAMDGLVLLLSRRFATPRVRLARTAMDKVLFAVMTVTIALGIPSAIQALLGNLAARERAELPVDVAGAAPGERRTVTLDPREVAEPDGLARRPRFLATVAMPPSRLHRG